MLALGLFVTPFVLSALLWRAAPLFARTVSPRTASVALTVTALITALSTGVVLCAVAALAVTEVPALARAGHWSATILLTQAPIPMPVGVGCAMIAAVLIAMSAWQLGRTGAALVAAARFNRAMGPRASGLIVVADHRAYAYAVPGLRGRTVVSRPLLRALDPSERRAVLAHEDAHLRHRHFLYVQLCELAAAANPLLRTTARSVNFATEAWADDAAARAVGSRRTVACALAKIALNNAPSAQPVPLAAAESDVAARVRTLLAPTQAAARGRIAVAVMIVLALVGGSASVAVAVSAHSYFEMAQALYSLSG